MTKVSHQNPKSVKVWTLSKLGGRVWDQYHMCQNLCDLLGLKHTKKQLNNLRLLQCVQTVIEEGGIPDSLNDVQTDIDIDIGWLP